MTHRAVTTLLQLLCAAGAIAATGCIGAATPEVRIANIAVADRTDEGVVLKVAIEGANRSHSDLELRSVRYWMELDGSRVFEGRRSPQATFSALGVQSFEVPVAIPIDEAPMGEEARYSFGASIQFVAPGPLARTFFDLGVRRPSVRTSSAGEIKLPPAGTSQ